MMTRVSRRQFLTRALVLPLAAAAGGAAVVACTPSATSQGTASPLQAAPPTTGGAAVPARRQTAGDYPSIDPRNADNFVSPLGLPKADGGLFGILDLPDSEIGLEAGRQRLDVLPGTQTDLMTYRVESGGKVFLNPIIRAKRGATASVRLANGLDEETIVHWHGLHVDWRNDGHPSYAVAPGRDYDYQFAVQNRAGIYWYHPHPHGLTGGQAYRGLAGLFIVEDDDEARLRQTLDLEFGVTDIPLVIQDKRFGDRGELVYLTGGQMEQFSGFFGDAIAVNLSINPTLDVASRLYRFRVLNGSNARSYRLAFNDGSGTLPFFLIGTDGGLLAAPRQVGEVFLSPAERADVLLDLRGQVEGDVVFLESLPFDPMHNEMSGMGQTEGHGGMSGMHGGSGDSTGATGSRLPEGERFHILRLAVRRRQAYDKSVPETLAAIEAVDSAPRSTRKFELSQGGMMQWLINGEAFEMGRALFTIQRSAKEMWEIKNADASMPHPMHLHGFQFRVVERRNSPEQIRALGTGGQGRLATDVGWKDTVLVWPGETVTIAVDLSHDFGGEQTYLWHCHNLEHEDQGMMVNFRIL